jgi:uncharacterized membrane protein
LNLFVKFFYSLFTKKVKNVNPARNNVNTGAAMIALKINVAIAAPQKPIKNSPIALVSPLVIVVFLPNALDDSNTAIPEHNE